jgi:thioester reductase-like protein
MFFEDTVFMTGFPGFVASRLVRKLASQQTQFFLLVEKKFVEKAMAEVEAICDATVVPLENFFIIEGDITKEDLGIQPNDLEVLRSVVTSVFHLAAAYDLAVSKDVAYSVNVQGTQNVNEFVRRLEKLQRYNYVSTCFIAGKRRGTILETELSHEYGFRNYYEETKYLAELEVEELKKNLPITIYRPSVIVGDSKTGETTKYDGIYFLIKFLLRSPTFFRIVNVGNDKVRLNLVPIDYVVNAIATLSKDHLARGKTLQLVDPTPLSTAAIFDELSEAVSGKRSLITPPASIVEWALNLSFSPDLTGLPHSAVPYFFISQKYDSTEARNILALHQISCPHFSSYAKNLIKFVKEHPQL